MLFKAYCILSYLIVSYSAGIHLQRIFKRRLRTGNSLIRHSEVAYPGIHIWVEGYCLAR